MHESILEPIGLYYRTNDIRPDRPTLLFVHGLSGCASAWFPFEKIFAATANVITFDLRGHGKSKKYPALADYAIDTLASDIATLVTKLQLEKFVLIGHSFGAAIALSYAEKYPEHIEATVFLSPAFNAKEIAWFRPAITALEVIRKINAILPFSHKTGLHIAYEKYRGTGDWNVRRIYADIKNTTLRTYLSCLHHVYRFDGRAAARAITDPTTIIHGTKDSTIPIALSKSVAATMPDATLIAIAGANHILVLNNIDDVSQAIATVANTVL